MYTILDEMSLAKDASRQEELRTWMKKLLLKMEELHKLKNERGASRKLKGVSVAAVVY